MPKHTMIPADSLFPWRLADAHAQVVAGRIVPVAAAALIAAVDAHTIEQKSLLVWAIDKGLSRERVAGDLGQILGDERVELLGITALFALVDRHGERDLNIEARLLDAIGGL